MAALGDQQCMELLQQIANAIETPVLKIIIDQLTFMHVIKYCFECHYATTDRSSGHMFVESGHAAMEITQQWRRV